MKSRRNCEPWLESLSVWAREEDLELNKSGTWPARHAFFFIPGFSIGSQASSSLDRLWKCAWPKLILFPRRRQENVYYFNSRACSRKKNCCSYGCNDDMLLGAWKMEQVTPTILKFEIIFIFSKKTEEGTLVRSTSLCF